MRQQMSRQQWCPQPRFASYVPPLLPLYHRFALTQPSNHRHTSSLTQVSLQNAFWTFEPRPSFHRDCYHSSPGLQHGGLTETLHHDQRRETWRCRWQLPGNTCGLSPKRMQMLLALPGDIYWIYSAYCNFNTTNSLAKRKGTSPITFSSPSPSLLFGRSKILKETSGGILLMGSNKSIQLMLFRFCGGLVTTFDLAGHGGSLNRSCIAQPSSSWIN